MEKHPKKAVLLATFNDHAFLTQFLSPDGTYSSWRLPRWRKCSASWKGTVAYRLRGDFRLPIHPQRLRHIRTTEVQGKTRIFFALELTKEEAAHIQMTSNKLVTRLVPFADLDEMADFRDKEKQLLRALAA